jgi:hypothetical protein
MSSYENRSRYSDETSGVFKGENFDSTPTFEIDGGTNFTPSQGTDRVTAMANSQMSSSQMGSSASVTAQSKPTSTRAASPMPAPVPVPEKKKKDCVVM